MACEPLTNQESLYQKQIKLTVATCSPQVMHAKMFFCAIIMMTVIVLAGARLVEPKQDTDTKSQTHPVAAGIAAHLVNVFFFFFFLCRDKLLYFVNQMHC